MNIAIYESDSTTILTHFTQWDTNRKIVIKGFELSEPPACQFYNAHSKRALVVNSELSGNDIIVPIPNLILQDGLSLIIDVYRETAPNDSSISDLSLTEGKVIHTFRIPVHPRPKPEDYEYIENIEYVTWAELSRRAEELLAKLEQTDFRRNLENRHVEYTTDGETWNELFALDEIKGDTGEIHNVTASVDDQFGTPYVDVTLGGTSIDRTFDLAFHNLRGFSPTAVVTGDEDTVTFTMEDINGRTTQTMRRYAAFLPTFDIDPLTGKLYMTTVSGYYDMEFYITESNGHLNVREVE